MEMHNKALSRYEYIMHSFSVSRMTLYFYSSTCSQAAAHYVAAGRQEEAESLGRKAVEILVKGTREFPSVVWFRKGLIYAEGLLASIVQTDGRTAEAVDHYEVALKLGEQLKRENLIDPPTRTTLIEQCLGVVAPYQQLARSGDARRVLDTAQTLVQLWERETKGEDASLLLISARVHSSRCFLELSIGQPHEARAAAVKGVELHERYARAGPEDRSRVNQLAVAYDLMRSVEWQEGNLEESIRWIDQANEKLRATLHADPKNVASTQLLKMNLSQRAEILSEMHRFPEAVEEYDRAIALCAAKERSYPAFRRAIIAAWREGREPSQSELMGYSEMAGEAIRRLGTGATQSPGLYRFAQVFALCHRAALYDSKLSPDERGKRAEVYAARALQMLRRVESTGLFKVPFHLRRFESDRTFAPLGSRPDFQALMADVNFPADPFAR